METLGFGLATPVGDGMKTLGLGLVVVPVGDGMKTLGFGFPLGDGMKIRGGSSFGIHVRSFGVGGGGGGGSVSPDVRGRIAHFGLSVANRWASRPSASRPRSRTAIASSGTSVPAVWPTSTWRTTSSMIDASR